MSIPYKMLMEKNNLESTMWRAKRVAGVPLNMQTLKSLTRAAKDVALNNKTPPELRMLREQICNSCQFGGKRCDMCGCFVKTKISLLNSSCPIGKWPSSSDTAIDSTKHKKTSKQTN
jgi:hypothetical protein